MDNTEKLKKKLDELAKDASFIIVNPETLEKLKGKGLPIESRFITYKEYLNKLFDEKRKIADDIIGNFPAISEKLANASVKSLYEEVRECYALGLFGATITLSVILLELSFKYKIFSEREKSDPSARWEEIEKLDFTASVKNLKNLGKITEPEKKELDKFNTEIRNPYIHYNLRKLVNGVFVEKMPMIDTATGEIKTLENVDVSKHQYLWFSGKKFRDKREVDGILQFCIGWMNRILG